SLGATVDEFLRCLELDRHRSAGTVAEYRADLERFCAYAAEHGVDDAVRPRPRRRNGIRCYQPSVTRTKTKMGGQSAPAPLTYGPYWLPLIDAATSTPF